MTRPPGYLLRLDPDELDLDRFEALVERAGRAMATGDAAAAAEALRRGLALWRGPALADLAFEPFAQAAAARLEEQRLAALESRLEADLALGRAPELIGELGALVGEHPLRERLRRSLVLALYRAGRQAEALEAYRAARRALVQDLGIEPGPELAELEGAILRHDPALAPRSSPASPVPAPDPPTTPAPSRAPTGPGGRAQARDGPVLRHRGLDRPHGALGRRGDARAAGPLPRARPRGGRPLRRHGEQAAGRRLHGPDGRAGRPRGPRPAGGAGRPRAPAPAGRGRARERRFRRADPGPHGARQRAGRARDHGRPRRRADGDRRDRRRGRAAPAPG